MINISSSLFWQSILKVNYGTKIRKYNIAYLKIKEVAKNETVDTLSLADDLKIDISPDGKIFGIEFLNANKQLGELPFHWQAQIDGEKVFDASFGQKKSTSPQNPQII